MKKYVCTVCGYVYDEAAGDPDNGIPAGTKWEDLPADYECPLCGVGKEEFEEENDEMLVSIFENQTIYQLKDGGYQWDISSLL